MKPKKVTTMMTKLIHQSSALVICPLLLLSTTLLLILSPEVASSQRPPQTIPSPCPNAIRINSNYQYRDTLHLICLEPNKLEVLNYLSQAPVFSERLAELGANQLSSFVDEDGTLHILLGYPHKFNGTSMYSIDRLGRYLPDRHTINTQYVTAMTTWRLKLNYIWLLAIANHPTWEGLAMEGANPYHQQHLQPTSRSSARSLTPMITIHSWRSTYFDSIQLIYLPHNGRVSKIEPININGMEFLVIAMEPDHYIDGRARTEYADSLVYRLDFSDGELNWIQYQLLGMRLTLDVKSFAMSHKDSVQVGYYMAILGQMKQDQPDFYRQTNQQNDISNYGLHIFKFVGDKFIRAHFQPIPGATKLDAITYGAAGDSQVIIALLSDQSKQVTLFLYDGLSLSPMQTPTYRPQQYPLRTRPVNTRVRRILHDTDNLHLFIAPSSAGSGSDEMLVNGSTSTIKRDQVESAESVEIPILSISSPNNMFAAKANPLHQAASSDGHYDQFSSMYQLPVVDDKNLQQVNDTSENSQGNNDTTSYNKRNLNQAATDQSQLYNWCRETTDSLLLDNFDGAARSLLSLPRVNQPAPIILNGNLLIEDDLLVTNLLYTNKIEEINIQPQQERVTIEQSPSNFSETFNLIQQAHLEIDGVKRIVDQILVDDGSTQDVFNPLAFETLVIECMDNPQHANPRLHNVAYLGPNCPHVGEINTSYLNNRNISDIRTQALLTARSMTITRDVRFEHLVLKGNVDIIGPLNDITIDDIVFKRGPATGVVFGHKHFVNGLYSASKLNVNILNGVSVTRDNFLTTTGMQRIDVPLTFDNVILDTNLRHQYGNASSRIELLNGVHLDSHLKQIAQLDVENTFQVPIHFDELIINGPVQLSQQSPLTGIDLENSWLNTMFKHSNQNVTAPMELKDVHISYGGDIIVNGLVNNVPFSAHQILMRNRDYVLPNPIVFEDNVYIRELLLAKQLNGVQVALNQANQRMELALLYNAGDQMLTGDKILSNVVLGGQSHFGGNINGRLNLTQLYHLANNNGDSFRFSAIRFKGNNIRFSNAAHVHIESTINGVSTNQLCDIARQAAATNVASYNRLKFEGPIQFKSLRCGAINGFNDLNRSFMTRFGNQRVLGTIRLTNGLVMNSTVRILSTLNDLPILPLPSAIASVVEETRTGHKVVAGDMFIDHIVAPMINNLLLQDVFQARSDVPQFVRGPMVFSNLDIENVLSIEGNLNTQLFNQLNISELIGNTLQYDTPQVIYNHIELNTLQLLGNANLLTNSLNGMDLKSIYADAVLRDLAQQITGPKTFTNQLDFNEKVQARMGIDDLTEDELRFNVLVQSDELIEGDMLFQNDLVVKKELEIQSGLINDIDLNAFVSSMLYENNPDKKAFRVVGNGSLRFHDIELNNLVLAGTIQGVDLSRDAILRNQSTPQQAALLAPPSVSNNQPITLVQQQPLNGTRSYNVVPMAQTRIPTPPYRQDWPMQPQFLHHQQQQQQHTIYGKKQAGLPVPPPSYARQMVYPNIVPRPLNVVNSTSWRPQWDAVMVPNNYIKQQQQQQQAFNTSFIDPRLIEHQMRIRAQSLSELSARINKYLSISLYYEIVQKQPTLGPVLGATNIPTEQYSSSESTLLMLKSTTKRGEPCLTMGQTIAIMAHQNARQTEDVFTQTTVVQETSNPRMVQSLSIGPMRHYLFILDSYAQDSYVKMAKILIYLWDYQNGMYQLKDEIGLDGQPIAIKAFSFQQRACVAAVNPHLIYQNGTGMPTLYCQESSTSKINLRYTLPVINVIDLDIVENRRSSPFILLAALSQKDSSQIGDLSVNEFSIIGNTLRPIAVQKTLKPLKLHFIKSVRENEEPIQLVVSHSITSNDDDHAITEIYSLRTQMNAMGSVVGANLSTRFYRTQLFKDEQFHDIQSLVSMDSVNPMLFLQSANSISIYTQQQQPQQGQQTKQDCDPQYALIHKIPSKGANKFLVFNERPNQNYYANDRTYARQQNLNHYLILSRDQCEHQQYSTVILKSHFRSRR